MSHPVDPLLAEVNRRTAEPWLQHIFPWNRTVQQCWAHRGLGPKSRDVAHMQRAFSVSMSSTKERALRRCSLDYCPVTRLYACQWDAWWYQHRAVTPKNPWCTSLLYIQYSNQCTKGAPTCLNVLTPSPYVPASGSKRMEQTVGLIQQYEVITPQGSPWIVIKGPKPW